MSNGPGTGPDGDDRPWVDRDPFRPERASAQRPGAFQRYRMFFIMIAAFVVIAVVKGAFNKVDTHGAEHSRFVVFSDVLAQKPGGPRLVPAAAVIPAGGGEGRPLVLLLAGRDQDPTMFFDKNFYASLFQLGLDAPDVVVLGLDRDSYAHDRADGKWGTFVLEEGVKGALKQTGADPKRVAIGGFGTGGFGALDLALQAPQRFCAVGAHSPAVYKSFGFAPPGAFDDASDFARHDVLGAAKQGAYPDAGPMRLDAGIDDPQRAMVLELAQALRKAGRTVELHADLPGHDSPALWQRQSGNLLRFYAAALKSCTGRSAA